MDPLAAALCVLGGLAWAGITYAVVRAAVSARQSANTSRSKGEDTSEARLRRDLDALELRFEDLHDHVTRWGQRMEKRDRRAGTGASDPPNSHSSFPQGELTAGATPEMMDRQRRKAALRARLKGG